ncbi:unnamed protein product [Urochloa humidicola]
MSTPGASNGSQAVPASQSVGSRPCVAVAANSATLPSDSAAAPPSDFAVRNTDVIDVEDNVSVGRKRKLRSDVWKEFDPVEVNGIWKAKCQWCKKHLGGDTRNGTTHLKNHLLICQDRATRELCDRLKMFYDVTELLSGTKYVIANFFFPKICNIFLSIRKWQSSDIPKVEEMSIKMKDKFNKYWSDVHGLMAVAAVLDPRYKLQLLNALFLKIHGLESVAMEAVSKVRDLLYNLVLEYQDSMENVATTDGTQTRPNAPTQMDDEDWIDTFDDYMSKQPAVASTYVRTELDLYLEEPLLPRTQELDIVQWWQHAGIKYPTLRKIARDVLAIPMTTVASESAFSTSGRIISPHRSRLAPSMIEALMCMQAWSHNDMLGCQSTFVGALMTCLDEKDEDMCEDDSTIIEE